MAAQRDKHDSAIYNITDLPSIDIAIQKLTRRPMFWRPGTDSTPEKRERFAKECAVMQGRWRVLPGCAPFYNPSLALLREIYSRCPSHAGLSTHAQPSRPTADQHLPNRMTQ